MLTPTRSQVKFAQKRRAARARALPGPPPSGARHPRARRPGRAGHTRRICGGSREPQQPAAAGLWRRMFPKSFSCLRTQGVQRPELRRPFKHGGFFLRPFYGVFTKGLSYSGRGSSGENVCVSLGGFKGNRIHYTTFFQNVPEDRSAKGRKTTLSHDQNLVLKWSTQNHVKN